MPSRPRALVANCHSFSSSSNVELFITLSLRKRSRISIDRVQGQEG